jgi:adenosylcobinamide-phosphate synthase
MSNPTVSGIWVILIAVAIDAILGEVPNRVHPVVGIGTLTHALLRRAPRKPLRQLLFGFGLVVVVSGVTLIGAFIILSLTELTGNRLKELDWPHALTLVQVIQTLVEGLCLSTLFAGRALLTAGTRMRRALSLSLDAGREALCHLCSRDPSALDQSELCGATVESLSENTSDSFIAPLFWYVLVAGCGLPGLYGAALYRSTNTLDAMIGYRGKYEYIGKTAAKLDDVLNWMPARLTALLLVASALIGGRRYGFNPLAGLSVSWRDHALTASPNAGWPMSAAAGVLGVELAKRNHYILGASLAKPAPTTIAACERLILWTGLLWVGVLMLFDLVRYCHD